MKISRKLCLLTAVTLVSTMIAMPADARNRKKEIRRYVRMQQQLNNPYAYRGGFVRRNFNNPIVVRPPVWYPSRDGGYYDGTGQIQGVVPGNQLFMYGGSLSDGRMVPNSPNVWQNWAGHLY